MTTIEADPAWKRMDLQKQINGLMENINRRDRLTANDRKAETSRQRMERDHITRIAHALRCARLQI